MSSSGALAEEIAKALCESSRDDHSDAYWEALAEVVLGVVAAHLDQHRESMEAAMWSSIDGNALSMTHALDAAFGVVFPREDDK